MTARRPTKAARELVVVSFLPEVAAILREHGVRVTMTARSKLVISGENRDDALQALADVLVLNHLHTREPKRARKAGR